MNAASDERQQLARAAALVLRVIRRAGADGRPVYSEEQINHAIPWIAFSMGADVRAQSVHVQVIIVQLMMKLNLAPGATPGAVRAAITDFYERHPIAPTLMADLNAAFREALVEVSSSRATQAARGEARAGGSHARLFRAALQPTTDEI